MVKTKSLLSNSFSFMQTELIILSLLIRCVYASEQFHSNNALVVQANSLIHSGWLAWGCGRAAAHSAQNYAAKRSHSLTHSSRQD